MQVRIKKFAQDTVKGVFKWYCLLKVYVPFCFCQKMLLARNSSMIGIGEIFSLIFQKTPPRNILLYSWFFFYWYLINEILNQRYSPFSITYMKINFFLHRKLVSRPWHFCFCMWKENGKRTAHPLLIWYYHGPYKSVALMFKSRVLVIEIPSYA